MKTATAATAATALAVLLALSGCSSSSDNAADDTGPAAVDGATPTPGTPDAEGDADQGTDTGPDLDTDTAGGEGTCERQQVPGHEGRDVRVERLDCAAARAVILEAVGKGRAAYDSGGLSCAPADAPDGQTDYTCTGSDGRRLTFRYGAA